MRLQRLYPPDPSRAHPESYGFTLVEIIIILAIIALLVAIAVPAFLHVRHRVQTDLCIHNLATIDSAKTTWAFETGRPSPFEPVPDDLLPHLKSGVMPTCPAGGEYEIGALDEVPFCTLEHLGHIYHPGDAHYGNGNRRPPWAGGPPPWAGNPPP